MSIEFRSARANRVLLIDGRPVALPHQINPTSEAEGHTLAVRDPFTNRLIGKPEKVLLAVFRQGRGIMLDAKYFGPTYPDAYGIFRGIEYQAY